jgi:hypothetical protein
MKYKKKRNNRCETPGEKNISFFRKKTRYSMIDCGELREQNEFNNIIIIIIIV